MTRLLFPAAGATLIALAIGLPLPAQTGAPVGELPALGESPAPPEGAPPHLTLIDREDLRRHAYWLADDSRAGRYTGSKGQLEAVRYIAEHFEKLGLEPLGDKKGYLQHYPINRVYLDAATALQFGKEKITTGLAVLAAGETEKISLSGKFVWCGNGTAAEVPAGLLRKIPLVVIPPMESGQGPGGLLQVFHRYQAIAQSLANNGASAGVVCLADDRSKLGSALTSYGLLPDHPRLRYGAAANRDNFRIPLLVLSSEQSRLLYRHVGIPVDDDGKPKTAPQDDKAMGKLQIVVKHDTKATASNVVAILRGTNKKSEAVVFSAHHDHLGQRIDGDTFNGADDNASGTAGLLDIAEAFAKGGERPSRSIIFLSVSGEELGLWGSLWFANNPTWPIDKIVADINIDMIGHAGGTGDRIEMQVTPSHQHGKYSTMVQNAVALGARFGITFTSGDAYYRRSDHFNFAEKGIPVVFFCDGEPPDYHLVSDHADILDYVRMEAVARLAFWTGWQVTEDKNRPAELGAQSGW